MTWYAVEKGIDMPPRCGGRRPVYPWEDMAVGDSFLIECEVNPGTRGAKAVDAGRQWAIRQGRPDITFASRSVPGGVRVWRVA